MVVRLTHGKKRDTQDYTYPALGRSFSLTGVAAGLRKALRLTVPDKIPYVLQGQAATLSQNQPAWTSAPSYSLTEGTAYNNQAVPVSAGGAFITLAWVSGTVGGVYTTTKPGWITFSAASATPTVSFSGHVDANDVTGMILSATANGQTVNSSAGILTVSAVPSAGLSIVYSASEGYATENGLVNGPAPRYYGNPSNTQMWYESAYATKDGTIIEAFTGTHSTINNNRVGEFIPSVSGGAGYMDEVFPNNDSANGVSGYDNKAYCYFDAIDSLVVFPSGAFDRSISDVNGSAWKYAYYNATDPYTAPTAPSQPPLNRPQLHSSNTGSGTYGPSLIYVPPAQIPAYENRVGYFNYHCAYSQQFDCAVLIGGAQGSSPTQAGYLYLTILVPSKIISSSITPRYYAIQRSTNGLATDGSAAITATGRAGICFLNNHVYWIGGKDPSGANSPRMYRSDITRILTASDPVAEPFVMERMPDYPGPGFVAGALTADPYAGTLTLINEFGLYLYDTASGSWQTLTSQFTEYASAFGSDPFISFPHAAFVDYRGTTQLRKTYFFGGWNTVDALGTAQFNDRHGKVRSIKTTRTVDVEYLNVQARHPENDATTLGTAGIGPLRSTKHTGLIVNGDYLYLWSGDWDDAYPVNSNTASGYKAEGTISQNGRQEIWRTQISDARDTGTATWRMVSNAYAEYPWTGSAGYYAGTTKGPFQPDGLGMFADSSGQMWMGPCDVGYNDLDGFEIAGQKTTYAAMYKWTQPGSNATGYGDPDVALGNGWTLPNQSRLQIAGTGTAGVDYDAGLESGSGCIGWGRPNKGPAYDASDNKARVVSVSSGGSQGARTFSISVYSFNCTADGTGKHIWTRQTVSGVPIQQMGGPPQAITTGVNTGWGAGGIGNTCQIGRTLYFSLMVQYTVNDGSGNYTTSVRNSGQIIAVNLDTFPAASSVSYVPLPEKMNWWLRSWDGPDARAAAIHGPTGTFITPGQYRSMVAVGTKLVIGPDRWIKIGTDPWACAYDTARQIWTTSQAPTNSDFPNTLMGMVAVPSLGEAWLCGTPSGGDFDAATAATYGWYDPNTYYNQTGQWTGRRIVRFKVN